MYLCSVASDISKRNSKDHVLLIHMRKLLCMAVGASMSFVMIRRENLQLKALCV